MAAILCGPQSDNGEKIPVADCWEFAAVVVVQREVMKK